MAETVLLVGTRKGAFVLVADAARRSWSLEGPHFLGSEVNHLVLDPRDGRTLLMAAKTGHLGPTVFRSEDAGRTWTEAERPPAFRKAEAGEPARAVERVFWLTCGHASQPGVVYAGTSPHGLFRSEDHGRTWAPVDGLNEHPWLQRPDVQGTPAGPILHSILVDPRDAAHLYVGLSDGGVVESRDAGATWTPLNKGCAAEFLPDPDAEMGHDPHCVQLHPLRPDRLYQQNHCGIYRMDRPDDVWIRIGEAMPKEVGDIGFPIALHPRDPDTAWVFPMDGTDVWPRTSPGGRPAVYRTRDAGLTWERQATGLPEANAWMTVYRQSLATDDHDPVGLYFGTSGGEVWASADEGERFACIARHLPAVLSVEAARRA